VEKKSCLIIGAGLAGLSAAYVLTNKNWDVTVLEADERIGGRVYSFRFPQAADLVCERGGEWIGKDHKNVRKLCRLFGLKLLDHRFNYFFFENGARKENFKAGQWPFSKGALQAYRHLKKQTKRWNRSQRITLDNKDWWTILRDRKFSEHDLLRRDLMDSTDFGESIRQSGGYSAAGEYFDSNKYDEMDQKIVGGNSELVKALASHIESHGCKILTSHLVAQISQHDGRVSVKTNEGVTFPARFCICTVPSRVLTRIEFQPRLPDKQWDAAKQLQYARIMKTQILCKDRFWMKSKNTKFSCFTDTTSDFLFDATLNQPGTAGILCSYSIGDKADDLAGYTHYGLKHKICFDLQAIFPTARVMIQDINTSPWQRNPMTEGAYAFYRPGQWFTVRELLQKRFRNVYFAGEHLADEQGFMEGAVDTGMIAARKLLRRVN